MHVPNTRIGSSTDSGTPRSRSYIDADGAHWNVYEQAFSDYDRRSGASLIFESDAAVRRVRLFPADWFGLTDAELMELSWQV